MAVSGQQGLNRYRRRHLLLLGIAARRLLGLDRAVPLSPEELIGQFPECLRGPRVRLRSHDRPSFIHGPRDFDVTRDQDIGTPADHGQHVVVVNADPAVGSVQDEDDSFRL